MKRIGRITALAFMICNGLFTTAAVWLGQPNDSLPMQSLWLLAGWMALSTVLGLHIGGKYDKARFDAVKDPLTGVYNRRFIDEIFPGLSAKVDERGKKISVLIVDVNDFKLVNDRYGHCTGDKVLKEIATALERIGRKGEIIARWGGDEFILICPYADRESSRKLAASIQEAVNALPNLPSLELSVSVGAAVYPDDGRTIAGLAEAADQHMYADKRVCKTKDASVTPQSKAV